MGVGLTSKKRVMTVYSKILLCETIVNTQPRPNVVLVVVWVVDGVAGSM